MSQGNRVSIDDFLRDVYDDEVSPTATGATGATGPFRVPKPGVLADPGKLASLGLEQPPLAPVARAARELDAMGLLGGDERPGQIQHPDLALRYASAAPKCATCSAWTHSHRGWGKCRDANEATRDLDVCTAWALKT
ncbi:MAG: hypothetical protein SFW09_02780 [Hyphomicrobiaceae bacterium]|nr:hypothetical protein [Hyphomicrobiaceae bacterium]